MLSAAHTSPSETRVPMSSLLFLQVDGRIECPLAVTAELNMQPGPENVYYGRCLPLTVRHSAQVEDNKLCYLRPGS